jgi:ABC-type multidrug transport system ATPase subunit
VSGDARRGSDAPTSFEFTVGRGDDADVQYDLPSVSRIHLAVHRSGQRVFIRDLGSFNGTFLGEPPVRIGSEPVEVNPEDVLHLGSFRLRVGALLRRLHLTSAPTTKGRLEIDSTIGDSITIGRSEECDLPVDDPTVSRRHVRVERSGNGWRVVDLGSSYGTWLSGKRIRDVQVPEGTSFQIGSHEIHLGPAEIRSERMSDQIQLDAMRIERYLPARQHYLLTGVSFTVYPSELIGILGGSGTGKTSLLNVISGLEEPTAGQVRFSGIDLHRSYDQFRGQIGFAPQDDILYPELTVREALYYSAKLRLPSDTSAGEIEEQVTRVLEDLDLIRQADTIIGDPKTTKTLSGGQRRRVNLGLELVTNPIILFADEPTSGLSWEDSHEVVNALRHVASLGPPVIMTIHQPSGKLYEKLDMAMILYRGGRLAYYGPARRSPPEMDSYRYFGAQEREPETIFERLNEDAERWIDSYTQSTVHEQYVSQRQEAARAQSVGEGVARRRSVRFWDCLLTLIQRLGRIKVRAPQALLRYLAPPLIILMLLLVMYHGVGAEEKGVTERAKPLFFLAVSALFFGLFNAAGEIVGERPNFRRERLAGLGIIPYLLSKVLVLGAITVAQVTVLAILTVPLLSLDAAIGSVLLIMILNGVSAVTLGLLLSSLVPKRETALILVPVILVAELMLSGFIEPVKTSGLKVLAAPMSVRWSAELLMEQERRGLDSQAAKRGEDSERDEKGTGEHEHSEGEAQGHADPRSRSEPKSRSKDAEIWEETVMKARGYSPGSSIAGCSALILLSTAFFGLTVLSLRRRDPSVLRNSVA